MADFDGCTEDQAKRIPALQEDLVKAWAIQESGGSDTASLAAWRVDPLQINVPGDWNDGKSDLGLAEPTTRNEGDAKSNLKAAVAYLCRKGFGKSGQPPKNRPEGFFDGWATALERYNGRSDLSSNGRKFSENYSSKIRHRAGSPHKKTPIEIR